MYGLRAINNVYVPDGTGRDWLIVGHPEFCMGRAYSTPGAREKTRLTMPARKFSNRGPRPLTPARIEAMKLGLNPIEVQQMQKSGSTTALMRASPMGTRTGPSGGSKSLSRAQSAPQIPAPAA